jgi:hypothetical protein
LNTLNPVSLVSNTEYNYTVDASAGSKAADRFRIVFKPQAPLPVTITQVRAFKQNSDIAVEWVAANQINVSSYQIEKSTNGRDFAFASTQVARGGEGATITYNWLDVNAVQGGNYYRIKCVDRNGAFKYSTIVKVLIGKGATSVTVSPNPVEAGMMNVQFVNAEKGKYNLRLTNAIGQIVFNSSTEINAGSTTQSFALPSLPNSGSYQLEIIAPDASKQTQQVLIKANK